MDMYVYYVYIYVYKYVCVGGRGGIMTWATVNHQISETWGMT